MRKFKWFNSYVKHVGNVDHFDSDTFCLAVDTITFENVDYDYFSIQVDDLHAEKTYSDMYYDKCKQSYENICRNYKFGY